MPRKKIGEILLQAGVLDEAALKTALAEQRRWGGHLGRLLIDMKLVEEEVLVRALSAQLNFPVIDLDKVTPHDDVLALVSADLAEQHCLVPIRKEGKFLDVAMSDPTNLGIVDELRIRTQLNVRPYLAGPGAIARGLSRLYSRTTTSTVRLGSDSRPVSAVRPKRESDGKIALPKFKTAPPPVQAFTDKEPGSAPVDPEAQPVTVAEIRALQSRLSDLEAKVERDENVLRKVMALLVEKGVATREEMLERIK